MSTIETESDANSDGYTPREIAVNDLDGKTLEEAFSDSMVEVEDGQLGLISNAFIKMMLRP